MVKTTKKDIRKNIINLRNRMTLEERSKVSLMVTERIIGHQWFYKADTILCFISFGSEIDTTEIIQEALLKKKKVFVPKVFEDQMNFYRITNLTELVEGYKGIMEPTGESEEYQYSSDKDTALMIMPGVAFDLSRNRIGYGKGFYDRYLMDKEVLQLHTIAIGFKCQMVEEIPQEEQDIRPYQIIVL